MQDTITKIDFGALVDKLVEEKIQEKKLQEELTARMKESKITAIKNEKARMTKFFTEGVEGLSIEFNASHENSLSQNKLIGFIKYKDLAEIRVCSDRELVLDNGLWCFKEHKTIPGFGVKARQDVNYHHFSFDNRQECHARLAELFSFQVYLQTLL